jgi:hypothetical protein
MRTTGFVGLRMIVDAVTVQDVGRGADADWVIRTFTFTAGGPTAEFTLQQFVFASDSSSPAILNVGNSQTYLDDFKISTPGCGSVQINPE